MRKNNLPEINCAICGKRKARTKDHVPPKGLFDKPRPSDLITVPACKKCNNGESHYDELFKIYIGLQVARNGVNQVNIGKEAIRSAKRNTKIRKAILDNAELREVITDNGIYTGEKVYLSRWTDEANIAFEKVIKRTVKGLYYHHYKKYLDAQIDTYWFNSIPNYDKEVFDIKSIGNGKFIYLHAAAVDEEMASAWFFQFYGAHWAGAITIPKHLNHEL